MDNERRYELSSWYGFKVYTVESETPSFFTGSELTRKGITTERRRRRKDGTYPTIREAVDARLQFVQRQIDYHQNQVDREIKKKGQAVISFNNT